MALGGSSRGYHFISAWRSCPRSWFFRYIAGLMPDALRAATSMGSILHELDDRFYSGEFRDLTNEYSSEVASAMEPYRMAWMEDDDREEAFRKIKQCFLAWRNTFGSQDLEQLEVEGSELDFEGELPNGIVVTGRVDTLFRDKETGSLILRDRKTTSWGADAAHKKVELNDQVTMYTWLIQKKYGDVPIEMIPDIVNLKPKTPTLHRIGSIRRTKSDVESFVWGLCHDTDRMEYEFEQYWANKAPAEYLFPRHATVCSEFGCEYEDICRARLDEATPPPLTGFSKVDPIRSGQLFEHIDSKPIEPLESKDTQGAPCSPLS